MDTISFLTLRLAEAIGLYMIVVGMGGLTAPRRWRQVMDDLERSPGLVMALGFPVFAVGAALVLIHSIWRDPLRSEEHTSELQSLMRISYAVFCLKKKKNQPNKQS